MYLQKELGRHRQSGFDPQARSTLRMQNYCTTYQTLPQMCQVNQLLSIVFQLSFTVRKKKNPFDFFFFKYKFPEVGRQPMAIFSTCVVHAVAQLLLHIRVKHGSFVRFRNFFKMRQVLSGRSTTMIIRSQVPSMAYPYLDILARICSL